MAYKPVIYSRDEAGIGPGADPDKWGPLGRINAVTFHHSAGPRATSKARAQALHRAYKAHHEDQGWGDIGYHFSIDDHGRLYRLHGLNNKGTHVGAHNTGNVGIMVHGNYDHDGLTRAQRKTLRWLFSGGFYQLLRVHEDDLLVRGHKEWPGHSSNACPGVNLMRHIRWLRSR